MRFRFQTRVLGKSIGGAVKQVPVRLRLGGVILVFEQTITGLGCILCDSTDVLAAKWAMGNTRSL